MERGCLFKNKNNFNLNYKPEMINNSTVYEREREREKERKYC